MGAQTEIAATRERCSYLSDLTFQDANPGRTFDVRRGEYRGARNGCPYGVPPLGQQPGFKLGIKEF